MLVAQTVWDGLRTRITQFQRFVQVPNYEQ